MAYPAGSFFGPGAGADHLCYALCGGKQQGGRRVLHKGECYVVVASQGCQVKNIGANVKVKVQGFEALDTTG